VNFWKVIFATVVIFGAGIFTGGLLMPMLHQGTKQRAEQLPLAPTNIVVNPTVPATTNTVPGKPQPRLPEVLSKSFLLKLDDQLHLSSEQHSNIEKIISSTQSQTRKLMQDARKQVRGVLTADQQARYDDLIKPPASNKGRNGTTNVLDSLMWTNAVPAVPPATVKTN
jgi:hypothetical protein